MLTGVQSEILVKSWDCSPPTMKFGQALKVEEKSCLQGNRLEFQDYFVNYKGAVPALVGTLEPFLASIPAPRCSRAGHEDTVARRAALRAYAHKLETRGSNRLIASTASWFS